MILVDSDILTINSMDTCFHDQSASSLGSDAANERNQAAMNGESLWSAEPAINGHSLSLSTGCHNGYLKGETN